MSHYLGLDASTQSLTAIVINTATGEIAVNATVNFGADLPRYGAPNGFVPNDDPLVRLSDPLMWVDALELLLQRVSARGYDWGQVRGISGSGQQHGSVYLNAGYRQTDWEPARCLSEQVRPLLSRRLAPIWMDSSTSEEGREIAAAAGGEEVVSRISGSRPIERFTGPQIRRFYRTDPEGYAKTARIHLVSSFMAYLLCGRDVPIDYGDGAGMNLMDLATGTWHEKLLAATAPELAGKLPPPAPSTTQAGTIGPYFAAKYGFRPETPVIVFSGDNPNSLVGMGGIEPGNAVISLGTSDTYFAPMSQPRTDPNGYGHVFGNPAGGFMCLIAFKNGSLAREEIKRRYHLTWDAFAEAVLERSAPGNGGRSMLYYYVPEITPRILKPVVQFLGPESDAATAPRAIVESQAVSMKLHSAWIGETPERILVTGGASQNPAIRQVLADVFQADILPLAVSNSAGLGAAFRAANAVGNVPWEELFEAFSQPDSSQAARPDPATRDIYAALQDRFAEALKPHLD